MATYTFRHRKIKNYRVGRFEFKNHLLSLRSDVDREEFVQLLSQFPRRVTQEITELNEDAMRRLESDPFASARKKRVILGVQGSSTIASPAKGTGVARPESPESPDIGASGALGATATQGAPDASAASDPAGAFPFLAPQNGK